MQIKKEKEKKKVIVPTAPSKAVSRLVCFDPLINIMKYVEYISK